MSAIVCSHIAKAYGSTSVIQDFDLEINDHEFVVFLGPSGCGKSTLLRMIAGLEETSAGAIEIEGRDVTQTEPAQRGVAMVFQSYALYPHLTVFENMAFSLRLARAPKQQITKQVNEAARILKIEEQLDKKPSKLSGGQRQRVAIGRAIVRQPKVFLFDEPLSNLDAELRVQMRLELSLLHKQLGSTMIYVTHDQVEAMTLADKIFVLRGGVVQQSGTPLALYDDPANQFVAGFIGSPAMNFLSATVSAETTAGVVATIEGSDGETLEAQLLDTTLEAGQKVTLGIRPEHMHICESGLSTTVEMTENLGGVAYLHARLMGGQKIVIERRGERQSHQDESISVWADAKHVLVFAQDGQRLR